MRGIIRKAGRKIYNGSALMVLVALWEILPRADIVPDIYLPPLSAVLKELVYEWEQGYLFLNIFLSLFRVLAGLLLAAAFGIGFGLVLGYCLPGLSEKLFPLFRFFGQINPYSLFPLFLVFLGIGEKSKIAIVAWTSVWPILFHTITGAKSVKTELLKSAKSMGASNSEILCKVIVPACGPSIYDGLRIGVEMAFFILIAAEMSGGTGGLGAMIHLSGMNFLIPRLFAAGLCTVILGIGMNQFFYFIQKRTFFWKETTRFFNTQEPVGNGKALDLKQMVIVFLLCVAVLVTGFFQSRKAYRLMNDPDTTGEFGTFLSE